MIPEASFSVTRSLQVKGGGGMTGGGQRTEASCSCMTEQGTRYELSQPECRTLARNGPVYNPYKQQREFQQAVPAPEAVPVPAQQAPVSSYAGSIIAVGECPMATFPESVQNRYSGQ